MQQLYPPKNARPGHWQVIFQILIWLIVLLFPLFSYNVRVLDPSFYVKECINTLFFIGLFYFHMQFLIPRFFVHRRIVLYLIFIVISVLFIITEQQVVEYFTFRHHHPKHTHQAVIMPMRGMHQQGNAGNITEIPPQQQPPDDQDEFAPPPPPAYLMDKEIFGLPVFIILMTTRKALFSAILILLGSGFIKIALEWFKAQRRQEELEKEKLNAELELLKQQVNPHFLFNSLNSIYALAQRKSENAPEAVLQLSQMMRYMIYESNTPTVALDRELDYIENFMNLKKLRLSNLVNVHYEMEGNPAGLKIEPMLLIPFIENAFKHGVSYTENCDIWIKINVGQRKLHLTVSNKIYRRENDEPGGFGLKNVSIRLDLLYPHEQHQLIVTQENNIYTVSLSLQLKYVYD